MTFGVEETSLALQCPAQALSQWRQRLQLSRRGRELVLVDSLLLKLPASCRPRLRSKVVAERGEEEEQRGRQGP